MTTTTHPPTTDHHRADLDHRARSTWAARHLARTAYYATMSGEGIAANRVVQRLDSVRTGEAIAAQAERRPSHCVAILETWRGALTAARVEWERSIHGTGEVERD